MSLTGEGLAVIVDEGDGRDHERLETTVGSIGAPASAGRHGSGYCSHRHVQICRRTRTRMATKSLTVTEEAYDRLREFKREDESFTEAILRLTGNERDVMKGFGSMGDVDGFRAAVESTREDLDRDLRERGRS